MRRAARISVFFLLLFASACTQRQQKMTLENCVSFSEDIRNGLHKRVEAGNWIYDIQFKPAAYISVKELGVATGPAALRARADQFRNTVWFNIKMSSRSGATNPLKTGVSGLEEYQNRLGYFMSDAAKALTLTYGGSEMQQVAYQFENNYGLTPADVMIVGFKIPDTVASKPIVLTYYDQVYGAGIIKVTIDEAALSATNIASSI